ncbi:MAG: MTAP family purine nucleoside phosphorylase [Candidatus ainarchaeum sp.]|nr:MTAP family purine nucleoside phosphorylase [Candidatus ainarchaeum sp.]
MLGIIGGTGIYSLGKFEERNVNTPYGFASVWVGKIAGKECVFIPRHGKDHRYPPHMVNYRANIWALRQLDADIVLATYACGSIAKFEPGDFAAAEDFIGFNAPTSFYEDFREGMKHINFSEPYAEGARMMLFSAAKGCGAAVKRGGIIATTRGPRFETRAEIGALGKMGANLASMTNAYEATLLHELEIPCAGLCIVTNYACGAEKTHPTHSEVVGMMAKKEREVNEIINGFSELV